MSIRLKLVTAPIGALVIAAMFGVTPGLAQTTEGAAAQGHQSGRGGAAPGTILGIPVARLRDPGLQKKVLFLAGVALLASVVVPFSVSPLGFGWSVPGAFFEFVITEHVLFPVVRLAGGYIDLFDVVTGLVDQSEIKVGLRPGRHHQA